jgi:hypothetical protein
MGTPHPAWCIQPVPISDTSPEIREMQFRILRKMSEEERSRLACEMTEFAREVMKAGIRRDHPDWTTRQVHLELLRRALWPQPLPEHLQRLLS